MCSVPSRPLLSPSSRLSSLPLISSSLPLNSSFLPLVFSSFPFSHPFPPLGFSFFCLSFSPPLYSSSSLHLPSSLPFISPPLFLSFLCPSLLFPSPFLCLSSLRSSAPLRFLSLPSLSFSLAFLLSPTFLLPTYTSLILPCTHFRLIGNCCFLFLTNVASVFTSEPLTYSSQGVGLGISITYIRK